MKTKICLCSSSNGAQQSGSSIENMNGWSDSESAFLGGLIVRKNGTKNRALSFSKGGLAYCSVASNLKFVFLFCTVIIM